MGPIANAAGGSRLARIVTRVDHVLVGDFVIGRTSQRYISLFVLLIATLIGFATYVREGWIWSGEVSLRPNMASTLAAVLLVSALYTRRLIEWAPSVYSLLSLVLNVTVTAILIQALIGGGGWSFMGLSMPYLVAFAIILTWAGIRPLAPIVWGLVVVFGIFNLQVASEAMGFWGYLFIILAAVGVFLQLLPRAQNFLPELRYEFTGDPSIPRISQTTDSGRE